MKIIDYGISIINNNGEDVTYFVTSINIDNLFKKAHFVIQNGLNVEVIVFTMEEVQNLGIINIQKLLPFIK